MKNETKRPTYSQVIAAIRKEFSCTKYEAERIKHQRNMGRVVDFCERVKKDVRSDKSKQKVWKQAFGRNL